MSINIARNIVYLLQEQYDELITTGQTITDGGTTVTYSENDTYIVPEQYDSTPTAGSMNPVTSEGIKIALDSKQDKLTPGSGISIVNGVISVNFEQYDGSVS